MGSQLVPWSFRPWSSLTFDLS